MALYGSGVFYGSGIFYEGASSSEDENIPLDLRFYRTSQDGIYVFWWGFDPAFISPYLASAGFELQLDTSPLFDSPNLVTFTQLTAITFQNGNVRKGFAVPVAARINGIVQTWYARVRTVTTMFTSDWSATLIWTIPMSVQQSTAEALMNSLPDYHVYGKGDLLKPVNQRNTNLWLVENMYGNQLDQVYYATYLTRTNNFVDLCVDEDLYQNFGVLFNFPKPLSMQYVDYRWILMNLFLASLVGSTNEAVILAVQAFTGVPPTFTNVRDINNFILNTVQDAPIAPSAPQTVFHTSSPFIDASLVVEQLSTLTVTSTVGFVVGPASDSSSLSSFYITSINSGTVLGIASVPYVASVRQLNPGDTIVQGIQSTVISTVTEGGFISPSNYTTNGILGNWTMHVATANTLQATFDIGAPIKIFNSLQGATTLTGTVTFTNSSTSVIGSGTSFISQLIIGQQITDANGIYLGTISEIVSNTSLILTTQWFGPTETGIAYLLQYTDVQLPVPVLWDVGTLAFGVIINIFDPGEFILPLLSTLESIVNQLVPAHVKTYFEVIE